MHWLGDKTLCILVEMFAFAVQVANAFLTNIAFYESTEGIQFDYCALINNKVFWIVIVVQVAYWISSLIVRHIMKAEDDKVEDAIDRGSIKLLNTAVSFIETKDFVSAQKALDMFDKIQEKKKTKIPKRKNNKKKNKRKYDKKRRGK